MCLGLKKDPATKYDLMAVSPTVTFPFKGTVTNVWGHLRFTPQADVSKEAYKVIFLKGGSFADDRDIEFGIGGKTAGFSVTLQPGEYEVKLVDKFNTDKLFASTKITVSADAVGDRATGNIASGTGKLMFCKEIDDNWKCVGESTTWKAGQTFNLYVIMPVKVPLSLTMWVIHKQKADGSDGEFVDEQIQNIGPNGAKYWGTTEGFKLPAGKYSFYSIDSAKRQQTEHSGNLKEYFAKATLVVQ